jgi:hypothetical protein
MLLQVDNREFATILAALRYWQRNGELDREEGSIVPPAQEYDIATDCGECEPLDANEIDELCERMNCEPSPLAGQLLAALENIKANLSAKDCLPERLSDSIRRASDAIAAAKAAGIESNEEFYVNPKLCEPSALADQLVAALERASAACEAHNNGGKLDYDWIGEAEEALDAAYAAGLGPKVSEPLKRLLMAEIDNEAEGGDSPATLGTVKDSLDGGYRPYDTFPVDKVKKELADLIERVGGTCPAKRFVTTADWESRVPT